MEVKNKVENLCGSLVSNTRGGSFCSRCGDRKREKSKEENIEIFLANILSTTQSIAIGRKEGIEENIIEH